MLGSPLRTVDAMSKETTHFGYESVPVEDKARRVKGVFDSVASRYDIMNDLMSGGLHRLWKRFTIEQAAVRRGQAVLDLAGGTGDLTREFASKVGSSGHVVLADINASMLQQGRSRLIDAGVAGNLSIVQVDAEDLPFATSSFDCITIAFGLRNVTGKETALKSMLRVLKPGGKLLILEAFPEPVGHYAVRLVFDDGHDTGLYTWKYLYELGTEQESRWQAYLDRLKAAGYARQPVTYG